MIVLKKERKLRSHPYIMSRSGGSGCLDSGGALQNTMKIVTKTFTGAKGVLKLLKVLH